MFNGTKSFTALKSCYHRNVETFKQIFAFTQFLITSLHPNQDPSASTVSADLTATGQDILAAPIPPTFSTSILRQSFLERKLEAGRSVAGIPVANLNIKVVDHWYRLGWYELFRRRFAILEYLLFSTRSWFPFSLRLRFYPVYQVQAQTLMVPRRLQKRRNKRLKMHPKRFA